MEQLIKAFILGNGAILTNVCYSHFILPNCLFGRKCNQQSKKATGWLGLLVLMGVLRMMTVVAFLLFIVKKSFGSICLRYYRLSMD